MEKALQTYGQAMPDWIRALATACDASSQKMVANRLGLSQPGVGRVLCHRVRRPGSKVEGLVRALLMGETVLPPSIPSEAVAQDLQRAFLALHKAMAALALSGLKVQRALADVATAATAATAAAGVDPAGSGPLAPPDEEAHHG